MSFTLFDVILFVVILTFAIIAMARGFIKAIFSKLCWIFGLIFAILFYKKLAVQMKSLVHNEVLSLILCFILIFVVVFLIIKIIQVVLERIFGGEIMKGLDRALGFFFGLVEGVLFVFVVSFILINQPWFDFSKLFEGSLIIRLLTPLLDYSATSINQVQEFV
ncbi:MAG: CvpA family protein [Treponema sp.]|nr:CvpA family protein [Treponema sp.]